MSSICYDVCADMYRHISVARANSIAIEGMPIANGNDRERKS